MWKGKADGTQSVLKKMRSTIPRTIAETKNMIAQRINFHLPATRRVLTGSGEVVTQSRNSNDAWLAKPRRTLWQCTPAPPYRDATLPSKLRSMRAKPAGPNK